jgi:hypothetical protein
MDSDKKDDWIINKIQIVNIQNGEYFFYVTKKCKWIFSKTYLGMFFSAYISFI